MKTSTKENIIGGIAILGVGAFLMLFLWAVSYVDYKGNACKRVVEIAGYKSFDSRVKYNVDICRADLDALELNFEEIKLKPVATQYFVCVAKAETEADLDFCLDFKNKRLQQEHLRLLKEEYNQSGRESKVDETKVP